ncbi:hypothetical protein FRZ02_24355 [Streptomyces albidoflavus]|uniref:Uncharacterized protein n=1 Tax=Streptomyces albidoflavus TaxID=1886 RepID=A0ABY3GSC0_9ACTN|nr:hypothetical protein FRZ02_24355 [Streptomyces albidoflavus]
MVEVHDGEPGAARVPGHGRRVRPRGPPRAGGEDSGVGGGGGPGVAGAGAGAGAGGLHVRPAATRVVPAGAAVARGELSGPQGQDRHAPGGQVERGRQVGVHAALLPSGWDSGQTAAWAVWAAMRAGTPARSRAVRSNPHWHHDRADAGAAGDGGATMCSQRTACRGLEALMRRPPDRWRGWGSG